MNTMPNYIKLQSVRKKLEILPLFREICNQIHSIWCTFRIYCFFSLHSPGQDMRKLRARATTRRLIVFFCYQVNYFFLA